MAVPSGTLTAVATHQTSVVFVWDAVEDATSYVLQVGTATGQSNVFNQNVGNVLTWTISVGSGTYYARVVPYEGETAGEASDEQVVTV